MRKDHIREYATSAFALYASIGGVERYRAEKYNELLFEIQRQEESPKAGNSDPVAAANIRAEREMESDEIKAIIADLEAVESTLDFIYWLRNGNEIRKAVEHVYFRIKPDELDGGVIGALVKEASQSIPASISSVYNWLGSARVIYAKHRGLRLTLREERVLSKLHI